MILSNKAYDFVKWLVQMVLPAFGALYFGLAAIWDLPASEQVVGTCAIIATFLGASLGISHNAYENSDAAFDGNVVVTNNVDGAKVFSLELDGDPELIEERDSIRFKVVSEIEADIDPEDPQV